MAADAQDLSKIDSAVSGISSSPKEEKLAPAKKRTSSSAPGVMNINDLGMSDSQLVGHQPSSPPPKSKGTSARTELTAT
jgi:hypothetical protein